MNANTTTKRPGWMPSDEELNEFAAEDARERVEKGAMAKGLVARIVAESRAYSAKAGHSREAAATHLYTTLEMELAAAFAEAGPAYMDRVRAMMESIEERRVVLEEAAEG